MFRIICAAVLGAAFFVAAACGGSSATDSRTTSFRGDYPVTATATPAPSPNCALGPRPGCP